MADEGEPRVLQVVTPNSSILLLDSESRDMLTDPMPTDFGVELNMSVSGGRRIAHRNLQWTQPIYTHNLSDWEIRISFSSINNYQTVFVGYVSPYIIYKVMAQAEGEPLEYTLPNVGEDFFFPWDNKVFPQPMPKNSFEWNLVHG